MNLAALSNWGETKGNNLKALTDAMIAGLSGTGAIEIIAKGSVAKLIKSEDDANDADLAMLDLLIHMGREADIKRQKALSSKMQNGVDIDMAEIKKARSSSPVEEEALASRNDNEPTGSKTEKKRKLGAKDGFLDAEGAENRERAKRSRSR